MLEKTKRTLENMKPMPEKMRSRGEGRNIMIDLRNSHEEHEIDSSASVRGAALVVVVVVVVK